MRVLDIDMDYFQSGIRNNASDSDVFWDDGDITVWDATYFTKFLENQCYLSKERKTRGIIAKHHKAAYVYWKWLVRSNVLVKPFKVTHIDAHSDLGFSMNLNFHSFLEKVRSNAHENYLDSDEHIRLVNSGNFLLMAALEGLTNEIDYVFHEKLKEPGEYLDVLFEDFECILRGKSYRFAHNDEIKAANIFLNTIDRENFVMDTPANYINVAISPSFVKKEISDLVEIIKEYIEPDQSFLTWCDNKI